MFLGNGVYFISFIALSIFGVSAGYSYLGKYKYYSRKDWNATKATDTVAINKPVPYIVIHHTAIPGACYDEATCMLYMKGMQNYHQGLDWGDIGYNFCVGSEGGIYEGRGWDVVGIHAGKLNRFSIGICLIGDWREERPPQIQLDATKALIKEGEAIGVLSDYKLLGHGQVMATECPGTALNEEISEWKHYIPAVDI